MATDPPSPAGFGLPTGILNPQTNLILRQVRWLDPVGQREGIADVWLENGRIRAIDPQLPVQNGVQEYPAQGCILGPGLVDVYSQSSEPGYEGRETLSQLVAQAVQGGFTRLTLLPGTQPVVDRAAVVTGWQEQHAQIPVKWRLWGALTQGLQGERMAELAELHRATGDVMAIFCPTKAFNRVDLPTLGRPTSATNPERNSGSPLTGFAPHLPAGWCGTHVPGK